MWHRTPVKQACKPEASGAGARGAGVRWTLQAGFFALFLLLFLLMQHPWREGIPYRLFLDLNPFTSLAGLAGTRIPWGPLLLFLGLGLLGGRLFCGYVCPLGFCIDLADRSLGGGRTRKGEDQDPGSGEPGKGASPGKVRTGIRPGPVGLQWVVLGWVLVGLAVHNSLPMVLDPIGLFLRALAVVFYPLGAWLANGLLGFFRPVAEQMGWYGLAYFSLAQPGTSTVPGSFLLLALVLALGLHSPRFWCRHVCPLGALLGLLARVAPMKRVVAETCTDCGRCGAGCPMGAIAANPRSTKHTACIQCRSCRDVCPANAVSFPLRARHRTAGVPMLLEGLTRRRFFGGVGLGGMLLVLTRLEPRVMKSTGRWLRPPGAIPEHEFLAACIRCGACLRICITHTLQASGLENGLIRWGTPVPDLRFAGCEQNCNLCGKICPTGAIRSLPLVERQHAKIGTAVLLRERCVAWAQDRLCLLCDEACPYNAIVFQVVEGHKRPFVDESRCNGCGMCEEVCPVEGEAAIVVYPQGELRMRDGSYKEALNMQRIFLVPKKDKPMPLRGHEDIVLPDGGNEFHG